jgi:seryl-tRNA synthetase
MIGGIKENFDRGIGKIKWFAEVLNERVKVEIALMRLILKSDEMKKKREKIVKSIGERVYELRNQPSSNITRDEKIREAVKEMEGLDADMESLKAKASEIDKAGI